jgi:Peptidogalycan biosysnthesis/recognition
MYCKKNIDKKIENIDIQYFSSIFDVEKDFWNIATAPKDIFLQYDYLFQLEKNPPNGVSFAYLMFWEADKPIGTMYFQQATFDAAKSIQRKNSATIWLAEQLKIKTLCAGNGIVTGEHGFYFSTVCDDALKAKLLLGGIDFAAAMMKKEGRPTTLNFVKDFFQPNVALEKNLYAPSIFSPNMILHCRPHWKTFDNYCDDMTTKYRTNIKRAIKKKEGLIFKNLSLQEIENQQDMIYSFYEKIADSVGFNYVKIHKNYFTNLKSTFGNAYQLNACYDGEKMVGFYSTLKNYDELETSFIGFDEKYNHSHLLYLNFLINMVEIGITEKVEKIIFSRTAMEIKSSIGAVPYEMLTYLKHKNSVINCTLPHLVSYLTPPQVWHQRKPFKD